MEKSVSMKNQEIVNLQAIISQLSKVDGRAIVVPNSMSVKSLENFMPVKNRMCFNFKTDSLEDFANYHSNHSVDNAACFIDKVDMSAITIFDLGNEKLPLHGDHKAHLKLEKSPLFNELLSITNGAISQKNISDFIEDWAEFIEKIDSNSGTTMKHLQASAALRNLTIDAARSVNSKVDNFGESMSAMEQIEAKNKDQLPSLITFTLAPFYGLKERKITLNLSVLTSGDKPSISLRIACLGALMDDISKEFKELVISKLDNIDIKVYLGTPSL